VIQETQDDFSVPSTTVTDAASNPAGSVFEAMSTSVTPNTNGTLELR